MAEATKPAPGDQQSGPVEIEFHYIKSNHYRVVHADGAYGGVTARGYLHVSFFNERRPIPRVITLIRDEGSDQAREEITDTRSGVVREVEVGVLLDEQAATELIEWLNGKLLELRALNKLIGERSSIKDA